MKAHTFQKKTKTVLLIRPINIALPPNCDPSPPVGLLSIGTVLKKKGYNVKIIDAMEEPDYKNKIIKLAKDSLVVGIGVWTAEIKSAYEITQLIKNNSNVPVVWGGWHPTLFPEQVIKDILIDYVIIGEGEDSFVELVKNLYNKKDVNKIHGLLYKKNEKIYKNSKSSFINLDDLPQTDFSLINIEKYLYHRVSKKLRRALPYESSRGCPHRCAFCINIIVGNRVYRTKSPKKVIKEIKYLIKKYKVDYIFFGEDNFFLNKDRVRKICKGIIKENLKFNWFAECRADYFRPDKETLEFFKLAKKSGLHSLTIGAESGSPLMLHMMKKDITIKDIINTAKICNEVGIIPGFSFIMGLPGETKKDIYETVDLIEKLTKICPIMCAGVNIFFPYPKCELTKDLIEKGLLKEPPTLKEWVDNNDELTSMYINLHSKKNIQRPWQNNPLFLQNVSYYLNLSFRYNESEIKEFLASANLKYYPYLFFRFLAKKRIKYKFFYLAADKWIYEKLNHLYNKLKYG